MDRQRRHQWWRQPAVNGHQAYAAASLPKGTSVLSRAPSARRSAPANDQAAAQATARRCRQRAIGVVCRTSSPRASRSGGPDTAYSSAHEADSRAMNRNDIDKQLKMLVDSSNL
jgi:hypothetical protein